MALIPFSSFLRSVELVFVLSGCTVPPTLEGADSADRGLGFGTAHLTNRILMILQFDKTKTIVTRVLVTYRFTKVWFVVLLIYVHFFVFAMT